MKEKENILLKVAQLKLAFAQKELERTQYLMKHSGAASQQACDEDQLKVDLAQCEVELAELECKEN